MSFHFDVIVVGAGISGSAAAFELSMNKKVLLLEQFELLHTRGSSHGNSRIFRKTYPVRTYSEMCARSDILWQEAERKSGMKVLYKTGGLDFGSRNNTTLIETIETCKNLGFEHDVLNASQIRERFPQFKVNEGQIGLYQPDAGITDAMEACRMFQWLCAANGCLIRANEKVIGITRLKSGGYSIKTSKSEYTCKQLVLCCGAWISEMLAKVGITVSVEIWRCTYAFWKIRDQSLYSYKRSPIWINFDENNEFYGFPAYEHEYSFKASIHYSPVHLKSPDQNDYQPSHELLGRVKEFVVNTFDKLVDPVVPHDPVTCLYTVTPDENFILDFHPEDKNLVIFGGGSGHAFKFGPVLGEIIKNMLNGQSSPYDLSLFSLDRLNGNGKLKKGPGMLKKLVETTNITSKI